MVSVAISHSHWLAWITYVADTMLHVKDAWMLSGAMSVHYHVAGARVVSVYKRLVLLWTVVRMDIWDRSVIPNVFTMNIRHAPPAVNVYHGSQANGVWRMKLPVTAHVCQTRGITMCTVIDITQHATLGNAWMDTSVMIAWPKCNCGSINNSSIPCDLHTGYCLVGACEATFYAPTCSQRCPATCINQNCNRTGECLEGCISQRWGTTCEQIYNGEDTCTDNTCDQTSRNVHGVRYWFPKHIMPKRGG